LAKLTEIMTIEEVKEKLGEIVDECTKSALELQAKTGFIVLERGFACVSVLFLSLSGADFSLQYYPPPRNRRAFPQSLPLGWCHAFPYLCGPFWLALVEALF
jgi:hypothetical protein